MPYHDNNGVMLASQHNVLLSSTCHAIAPHQSDFLWWNVSCHPSQPHARSLTQISNMGHEVNKKKADNPGIGIDLGVYFYILSDMRRSTGVAFKYVFLPRHLAPADTRYTLRKKLKTMG